MTSNKRPTMRGHSLPFLAALLSGISVTLLFGGRDVLPQAAAARASAATPAASAAGGVLYVPASAHASGANGANWLTDVEVHNPGTVTASFTIQLLRRDADNSSPQSRSYTLGAQQARRFIDILVSEFGTEGAAALRVTASSGLVVTSRTYNFVGQNPWSLPQGASFGQFVPGFPESEAIGYGQEGRLIQLTQQASTTLDGFRTNLGIVNTTGIPIDVRIDHYRADGTFLGRKDGGETNLPPYGFRQLNEVFSAWGSVTDGYAVVKTTTPGGALFAFATVVDNHNSGDPIFVPAVRLAGSGPAPTATPTVTPIPGSGVDLAPYKPTGWENPLVPSGQKDILFTTVLTPSLSTYVRWAVANNGPADITETILFELRIDSVPYARWKADAGLRANYYIKVENYEIPPHTLTVGFHTLTIVADPDNTIQESNESNNSWGKSWEWTEVGFVRGGGGEATSPARQPGRAAPVLDLAASSERPMVAPPRTGAGSGIAGFERVAAASTPVYIPASAHATGMNGSNWRTDVEVHNPGMTAVTFTIEMLKQGSDNGTGVPAKTFSLGPQQSVRYVDILSTVFGTDGAAALRVTPQSGTILVNSRTYNLIGANSVGLPVGASFGQFVPGLSETEAIGSGEEGRIIQLTHRDSSSLADFRTNIGFVNTTATAIDLRIDLMGADGGLLATIQDDRTHLRAYETKQINGIFGEATSWLADGYAIVRTTTAGGRFFAYATVIDNHLTGDPVFVPAARMSSSGFTYGSPRTVPVNTGSAIEIPDATTGVTVVFPQGGHGTLTIATIASVPNQPASGGKGFHLEFTGPELMQWKIPQTAGATTQVYAWGPSHGCYDVTLAQRWNTWPESSTQGGYLLYDTPDDSSSPGSASSPVWSLQPTAAPMQFSNYWVNKITPTSTDGQRQHLLSNQVVEDINGWLARLADPLLTAARSQLNDNFGPIPYVYGDPTGGGYIGFAHRRVIGTSFSPRIVFELGNAPAHVVAHETGHLMNHLLLRARLGNAAGDAMYLRVEALIEDYHGLGDVFAPRRTTTEEIAYVSQYLVTGTIDAIDPYDLRTAGAYFTHGTPSAVDYPSQEGFGAILLTNLLRPSGTMYDWEHTLAAVPVIGASWNDVAGIIGTGAANIDEYRTNIQAFLDGRGQGDLFGITAERIGWSYHGRGTVYATGTRDPVPDVTVTNFIKIGSTEYTASQTKSDSSGQFKLPRLIPGCSKLRVELDQLKVEYSTCTSWERLTNVEIDLGDQFITPSMLVSIAPATVALAMGASQQFTATVTGSSNKAVTWSVQEGPAGGTVTTSGLYKAPGTAGTYHVKATSQADPTKSGTATVTVGYITVYVSPYEVTVQVGHTQQFTAVVTGTSDQRVTWTSDPAGAITADGLFTAAFSRYCVRPEIQIVYATSRVDPTRPGDGWVTIPCY